MAASSTSLHENQTKLKPETVDRHRAIASLMEELEAVDWYDQRVDATEDDELRAIIAHNRDEEKEHAAMILEWLRRKDASFAHELKTYLFTKGTISELDEYEYDARSTGSPNDGSLNIGSLKEEHPS